MKVLQSSEENCRFEVKMVNRSKMVRKHIWNFCLVSRSLFFIVLQLFWVRRVSARDNVENYWLFWIIWFTVAWLKFKVFQHVKRKQHKHVCSCFPFLLKSRKPQPQPCVKELYALFFVRVLSGGTVNKHEPRCSKLADGYQGNTAF